jgi:hypothetical protein
MKCSPHILTLDKASRAALLLSRREHLAPQGVCEVWRAPTSASRAGASLKWQQLMLHRGSPR